MSRHMQTLACRFHPEAILIEDSRAGDMICPMCGLVVGDRMIDVGSEWRTFSDDSDHKNAGRVGAAQSLLYDQVNLETMTIPGVGASAIDDQGRQRYTNRPDQISSADKALKSAHQAIRILAGRIDLSKKVVDRAFLIYKTCYENKLLHGRSQDAIVASCVYFACRKEGSARTIKEICGISTVSAKEIGKVFNKMKRLLPASTAPQSIEIKDLVPRFCSQLNLEKPMIIRKAAIHIAQCANDLCDIQGRKPSSIAAASIYLACMAAGERITKKDIKVPTDVSEVVTRDIYKIMLPFADKLFPSDFVFKCPITKLPAM